LLLSIGADPCALAADGQAPTRSIYQAASMGDIEQIKLHVARGTDLNKPDADQNTALGIAIRGMRAEVVKLLVDAGADVTKPSRDVPPVIMATAHNSAEIVDFLVSRGADVESTNASGMTPLIVAAESGYLDIVQILVANKANVNATDRRGQTPLGIAKARRQTDIEEFLRQHGAEEPPNMFDDSPYGSRGMARPAMPMPSDEPGIRAGDRAGATSLELLGDPNEIRARVATFPDLAQAIATVNGASAAEQRNWRQRRMDNRTMLIRSVEKQFEDEMVLVKRIGQMEKAVKTLAAIDKLVANRKARWELIYEDLREERRAAMLAEKEATARGRTPARGRGRAETMDPAAGGGAMDPYGAPAGRPAPRPRVGEEKEVDAPPVDPETESQARAWLASDPLDKRDLLNTVHELDLREYDALRQTAVAEEAKKTAAAIGGLMLSRQDRVTDIMARMAEEDERLERREERTGATRGRTGRVNTGQEDTATQQRAGRRYR